MEHTCNHTIGDAYKLFINQWGLAENRKEEEKKERGGDALNLINGPRVLRQNELEKPF
jgi:hypothetical protein